MRLILTAAALADIASIGDWIAKDNPKRAVSFVAELKASCKRILDLPRGYPLVPRYEHQGLRRKVHGNYLIFYRLTANSVEVIHVLHGARDYEAILFPPDRA